jgi:hypothetical protein
MHLAVLFDLVERARQILRRGVPARVEEDFVDERVVDLVLPPPNDDGGIDWPGIGALAEPNVAHRPHLRMDRVGLQVAAPDADALGAEKAAIRIQQVRDVLTRRRAAHRPCEASFREVGFRARHAIAPSQVATIVADGAPGLKGKEGLRAPLPKPASPLFADYDPSSGRRGGFGQHACPDCSAQSTEELLAVQCSAARIK